MAEQSGKREFFNEERPSEAPLATAENFSEGETASTGNHSTTIIPGTSNGREYVNLEMEIRSRASDIGCCNIIQGCIRTCHSERGVSYHRNFESSASRPTLSESADPGEIMNATTAIAEAAEIAAETTDEIAYHIKCTARVLRTHIRMVKDKANRMLRKRDRSHYNFTASNYEEDLVDAEIAIGDAESACQTAFNAMARARDAVRQLSAAINSGSTETKVLEVEATTAFNSANRATIDCYLTQYSVLQTLRKCKIDLITPLFPICECERWKFINGRAIVLASIAFVAGCVMFVCGLVESIRDSHYSMLGIGLALIGMSVVYLLYKLRSFWRKMQARQIRNDELERSIEDIDTTLCHLWRDYKSAEIPSIPLNEE